MIDMMSELKRLIMDVSPPDFVELRPGPSMRRSYGTQLDALWWTMVECLGMDRRSVMASHRRFLEAPTGDLWVLVGSSSFQGCIILWWSGDTWHVRTEGQLALGI